MSKKKRIAILYGGRSVEHGVSVNSARNIFQYIDKKAFQPIAIGISKTGKWFLTDGVSKEIEKGKPLALTLDPTSPTFAPT
jgi:D-alanine-D-alanine ligase